MKELNSADIMREKQRIAQLKKEGKWVEEEDKPKKKEFDASYLQQFDDLDVGEEEEKKQPEEEEKKQESEVIQPKGKKGKKNK